MFVFPHAALIDSRQIKEWICIEKLPSVQH